MYSAGIAAAQGLVRVSRRSSRRWAKQMATLANAMVTAIKRALKIKSPSQVFEQVGVTRGRARQGVSKASTVRCSPRPAG